jgi:hypothetical protein
MGELEGSALDLSAAAEGLTEIADTVCEAVYE